MKIGPVVGGAFGGMLGAAVGIVVGPAIGHALGRTTDSYEVPICAACLSRISTQVVSALAKEPDDPSISSISTPYFERDIKEGHIILTFANPEYAKKFRGLNQGRVFDSVADSALKKPHSSDKVASDSGETAESVFLGDMGKGLEENMGILMDELLPRGADNWYRRPTIPPAKVRDAIAAYAPGVAFDEVIALVAGGSFRSGKEGCILTTRGIHYRTTSRQGDVSWTQIRKAVSRGRFPSYPLELTLNSGDSVRIDCASFAWLRPALERLINQIAMFTQRAAN